MRLKLILIKIVVLVFFSPSSYSRTENYTAKNVGCFEKNNNIYKAEADSFIELNDDLIQNLIPATYKSKDLIYLEAIELQIKHLIGFFRNSNTKKFNRALSSYREKIEIIKVEQINNYNNNYEFTSYLNRDWSFSKYKYHELAFKTKKLTKKGLRIHYRTSLILSDCSKEKLSLDHQVIVPRDPYFSYWIEPKNYFESKKIKNQEFKKSNCHTDELLKFGNVDQLWFFWNPLNCRKLNTNLVTSFKVSKVEKISDQAMLNELPLDKDNPIEAYFVFGKNLDKINVNQDQFLKIKSKLIHSMELCVNTSLVSDCLTKYMSLDSEGINELALYYLLFFLRDLNTIVDLNKFKLSEGENFEFAIELEGILRISKQKINIKTIYARTNLDYGPPPSQLYKNFLFEALRNGDVFSYLGHSGLGENLKLKNLSQHLKNVSTIKRNKPLWIGLYNCEGFSYFGSDFETLFDSKKSPKLFLTLSTGLDTDVKFPLAQLARLNSFKEKNYPNLTEKFVNSKDYYVEVLLK